MGGPGSGWFAEGGHVSHKTVDVLDVGRVDKKWANVPDAYEKYTQKSYLPQEAESIGAFVNASGHYVTINKIMRGIDPTEGYIALRHPDLSPNATNEERIMQAKNDIDNIKSAMEKTPVREDTIVYRGIPETLANKLISGKSITDNAFQSTSLSLETASKFAWVNSNNNNSQFVNVLEITAKKGEPAIFSNDYNETELLLTGGGYKATGYTVALQTRENDHDIPTFSKSSRIIKVDRIATGEQTPIGTQTEQGTEPYTKLNQNLMKSSPVITGPTPV